MGRPSYIHAWVLELNIPSSDIATHQTSLLEARVDAWNLQATDRHTDPAKPSLHPSSWPACLLGTWLAPLYLCPRPTYAPQVSHDPRLSPDLPLPIPSSSTVHPRRHSRFASLLTVSRLFVEAATITLPQYVRLRALAALTSSNCSPSLLAPNKKGTHLDSRLST